MKSLNAQSIFENLIKEFIQAGIPLPVNKLNPSLKYMNSVTRLGSCSQSKGKYTISISVFALQDENQIRNTLAHELVHTLPGCMNHGTRFHQYGQLVYNKLGITIESRADDTEAEKSGIRDAYREKAKYKVVCRNCGFEIYRQRKSELITHPSRYRCSKCHGMLDVYVRQ